MSWYKDDIDRRLIALLQADARASTASLARRLGVARSTVHERIARLEKLGVITGYAAILSRNPSDENSQALVMLSVLQQQSRQVVDRLNAFPEIKLALAVSGEHDIFLTVEAPHLEDLDALLDEIAEIPGVERTKSWIVLARKFDRRYHEVIQHTGKGNKPGPDG
jgi:DNA-binding Lrp family transcriptional regulator